MTTGNADPSTQLFFTDRIPIRIKMMIVGLAVALATACAGWIGYQTEQAISARGIYLYDHIFHSSSYARAAQKDFALLRNLATVSWSGHNAAEQGTADTPLQSLLGQLSKEAGADDPEAAARFLVTEAVANLSVSTERTLPDGLAAQSRNLIDRIGALEDPVLTLIAGENLAAAPALIDTMTALAGDLDLFVDAIAVEGFRVREELGQSVARSSMVIAGSVIIAILIAVAAAFFMGELVSRQVFTALRYSDDIAQGRLDRAARVEGRTELALLMKHLDRMRSSIKDQIAQIEALRKQADDLVDNILPRSVAARLRAGESRIADARAEATILFMDLVGFTELSRRFGAAHLIEMLDDIFRKLDDATERHGIEKIKTIGDAYMAAAGVTTDVQPDNAARCAAFALEAREIIRTAAKELGYPLDVRIGIHNGPVVAGMLGTAKLFFDVWGEAVNHASRIEGSARTGEIRVSETTYWRLRQDFALTDLGTIELKGIGLAPVYRLDGPAEAG